MKAGFGVRRATMIALGVMAVAAAGCDGDDSSSAPGGGGSGVYSLTVGVTSESGTLTTIAVDLQRASAEGDFVTDGGRPDCDILAPDAFGVLSVLGPDRIRIGVASFIGFDTPAQLVRCRFEATVEVVPDDFAAEVVDAAAPDGETPSPPPVVELTSIEEEAPAASTTTLPGSSTTTVLPGS